MTPRLRPIETILVAFWLPAAAALGACTLGVSEVPPALEEEAAAVCTDLPVVASAASADDGNRAGGAFDGDLATRWSALGVGQWIRADLGTPQALCSLSIAWYRGDTRKNAFEIQVSSDGVSFSRVLAGQSSGTTAGPEAYDLSGAEGRFVRIVVNGNTVNQWASISEIAIAGGPPDGDPPPPPPPSGACTVDDTSGCVAGAVITRTDQSWSCNRPLAQIAAEAGGRLPLKVVLSYTRTIDDNGAALDSGCAGDGDPRTIDLILDVKGDGRTYGPGVDAVKVRLQAGTNGSIQVTGRADCGKRISGAHQDGVQAQGGRDVAFVDFVIGNYEAGLSTCQGAGGTFFYSSANGYTNDHIDVIRGSYIGCNHGLNATQARSARVIGARFRSGRTDGTDPVCVGYAASPGCTDLARTTNSGVTCQSWNRTTRAWQ
ncbi:MAG TPA: discoidin domain-containing protein [Kofleriaceae bacterium]